MKNSIKHGRNYMMIIMSLVLGSVCFAEEAVWPVEPSKDVIRLDIGSGDADEWLGFGWSQKEGRHPRRFRWITQLEADIEFIIETPADIELWVDAQPLYLNWKQQRVGIYINQKYIGKWEYPMESGYFIRKVDIPAKALKSGSNLITLRMGYRSGFSYDSREMALGVDKLLIRKKDS